MFQTVPLDERKELAIRLRELRPAIQREIESIALTSGGTDELQADHDALTVRIDDVLEGALAQVAEVGEGPEPSRLTDTLLQQVRRAARAGVDLDVTLRRFVVIGAVVGEFVSHEASELPLPVRRALQRERGLRLDRTLAEVAEIYREIASDRSGSSVTERIERGLAGDSNALKGLDFELDGWNLGVIAHGCRAGEVVVSLAEDRSLRCLAVRRETGLVWAWLAGRDREGLLEFARDAAEYRLPDVSMVLGEMHRGMDGWRLTHQEARAALDVMLHRPGRVTRSSDVAPLAALLADDVLAELMRETYLRPLRLADPGARIRRTLRAYIDTSLNAASTSAMLGIDRSTVQRHLRRAEDHLGRQLNSCFAELKLALELEELETSE